MKNLIFLFALMFPVLSFAQEPEAITDDPHSIDRAMSPWARARVNQNTTYIFDEVDGIRSGDTTLTILTATTANITTLTATTGTVTTLTSTTGTITTLTGDTASYEDVNLDTATIGWLINVPPHAEISFQDSAFVIDLTQNEFSIVTNAGNDLFTVKSSTGITTNGDSITIVTPGDYIMTASLSFSGTAGDVFEFTIYKNGAIAAPKLERSTSQTDIGNVSLPYYLESLVAGDDLSLRITNTANSDDATVIACSWVTWLLHR